MNKWTFTPLSECLSKVIDYRGRTPKKLGLDWSLTGYRALSANNVKFNGLDKLDSVNYASEELYKKWMKEEVFKNDLLLTSEAPSGQVMLWDSDEKIVLSQRLYALRVNENIDSKFLKYYLQSPLGQKEIFKNNSGSTVAGISVKTFSNILVSHPIAIDEQRIIGHILFSIDKKIDCNNRINTELESVAKTLYDYWFIQFDFPNSKGKPYKSSGGAMMFSKTLNRDIPADWRSADLASITLVSNESLNPSEFPHKEFKHFSIPVFDATKTFGVERGSSIGSNKFLVIPSDILVSKLNPWFNRVILGLDEDDQICSTEFVVWRPPSKNIRNFLYLTATSNQFIAHCVQSATGTSNSHKRVNPTVMMSFSIPYEPSVADKFGSIISPMIERMSINQRENEQLIKLRDWLLPLLMNGQISIR